MNEMVSPGGEVVDVSDPDELIEAWKNAKEAAFDARNWQSELAARIGEMAQGDAKTCRLRGDQYRVKVTYPSTEWSQTVLKGLVADFPDHASEVIKVATYRVDRREYNKIKNESGKDYFEQFKEQLVSTETESTRAPSIWLEDTK